MQSLVFPSVPDWIVTDALVLYLQVKDNHFILAVFIFNTFYLYTFLFNRIIDHNLQPEGGNLTPAIKIYFT